MSNGTIITSLSPGENDELNKEKPNDIDTPCDSKDNKTKETNTAIFKSCCKKLKCLEIIFFFFALYLFYQ